MNAIGPLGADDAAAAIALWTEAGLTRPWNDPATDYARALAGATSTVLGMRGDDGALIATVMTGADGHRGWLYYLAVAVGRRGEGIGRAMVAAAEVWLGAHDIPKVHLMIRGDNLAVREFYAAIGYAAEDVTVMSRRLG